MNYFFYICLSLTLIITHTTIMPNFAVFEHFYDILIPFIFYLGLYRNPRESIPIILLLGLIMDSLSGGPFGVFSTTYFWLYVLTRCGITFLHAANKALWLVAVAAGVLIENLIIVGATAWLSETFKYPPGVLDRIGPQLLWALCTGPILVVLISIGHIKWQKWQKDIAAAVKEQDA